MLINMWIDRHLINVIGIDNTVIVMIVIMSFFKGIPLKL